MREISVHEFVRRMKMALEDSESRYAFFLGAGCSVTSGIPSANSLVKQWLPKLKLLKEGNEKNADEWAQDKFKVTENELAKIYGEVIEDLFHTSKARQNEIERLTENKDPAFGYVVLSQLISHNDYGKHFNLILTTNFDDLMSDALYLYAQTRPLVIVHESLAGFATLTRSRPLIIKLHGDAKLEPKNIHLETRELEKPFKNSMKNMLRESGLIFLGYGGNDKSIVQILSELDSHSLPWGVYWVSNRLPSEELKKNG